EQLTVADLLGAVLPVVVPRLLGPSRHRRIVSEQELSALDQPAIRGKREQGRPHLVNPGQPGGETLPDGVAHRPVETRLLGQRLGARDEPLSGVDEETGRLATGVLDDDAARRIRRVASDARGLERGRVAPAGVPVHANEDDWMAWRRAIERAS